MPVDFAARRKQAEDEGLIGSGGGYFKCKEGANRIRLLSDCLPHANVYKGQRNFKWLCYVLDRTDGQCKPFFMGHRIYKQIEALQTNPDYEFFDVPMPYDVTIHAKDAGKKEVVYTVMPARKNTELTAEEQASVVALKPLKELQDKITAKQAEKAEQTDSPHADADFDPADHDDDAPF